MRLVHDPPSEHARLPRTPRDRQHVGGRDRCAAREVVAALARGGGLAVALVAGAAVATVLLLLVLTVAAPLGTILLAWIVWRSDRELVGSLARLRARWGRSARVIAGGLGCER